MFIVLEISQLDDGSAKLWETARNLYGIREFHKDRQAIVIIEYNFDHI